jgi:Spy/CpxP family protein refolding chaperone
MRLLLSAIVAAGSLVVTASALAQTPAPAPSAAPVNPAAAAPVPSGKRFACQAASQALKGQDRKDQMQLCMAQARLDCLKQAIDQKVVGPERIDFVKTCVQE